MPNPNLIRDDEVKERSATIDDTFYNVIMHNDDITPVDYVIMVLMLVFDYMIDEAARIMLHIHQNGQGVVATLSMEAAYKKMEEVEQCNEKYNMLLQTTVEEA